VARSITGSELRALREVAEQSAYQSGRTRRIAGSVLQSAGLVAYEPSTGLLGAWTITEQGRAVLEAADSKTGTKGSR